MKIAEIPFAVLRFQYQIARIPFQLIEDQMAARIYSEAPARLFYERSLGTVDAAIGNLLGDGTDDLRLPPIVLTTVAMAGIDDQTSR